MDSSLYFIIYYEINYFATHQVAKNCRTSQKHFLGRSSIWLYIYCHYASNNMRNQNICCVENVGISNYLKRTCIYQSNGRGFKQTTKFYWKEEFGYAGDYLNYFCPSLKCIYNIKSRILISFYKKTNTIYFKSLCSLTFKYLTSGIKNSLLLALLTM